MGALGAEDTGDDLRWYGEEMVVGDCGGGLGEGEMGLSTRRGIYVQSAVHPSLVTSGCSHPHRPGSSSRQLRPERQSRAVALYQRCALCVGFYLLTCIFFNLIVPARRGLNAYSQSCISLSLVACSNIPRCSVQTANVYGVC